MKSTEKPILFVSSLPPPFGGISTWTKIIFTYGLPNNKKLSLVNTRILGTREVQNKLKVLTFSEFFRTIKIFISLLYQLIKNRPQVVHFSISLSSLGIIRDYFCIALIKIFKVPIIAHYRGNFPDFKSNTFFNLAEICLLSVIKISNASIVENLPSLAAFKKKCKNEKDVFLVPNFIEDSIFENVNTKNENLKKFKIFFAGRISKAKGAFEILEVAKTLPDIEFHLYGSVHYDMEEHFKQVPENIFLHGNISHKELLCEMLKKDCLLFPSYTEGFPLTVVEAMAQGLPVISTRVGAIPEMVTEEGGYLVETGDIIGLINAIKNLIDNPLLKESMGKFNREKSYRNYRYSVVINQLIKIYDHVLLRKRK